MGFRKYKNENSAELVHKMELFDLGTGDPAMANGRRQYLAFLGEKSLAYKNAVEAEAAQNRRLKKSPADFTFEENIAALARRLAKLVVSAYIDIGDTDEPEIVEFDDVSKLSEVDREKVQSQLRALFRDVTDLAIMVNEEVVKGVNFLPGRGKSLSSLLSSESGTELPQKDSSNLDSTT